MIEDGQTKSIIIEDSLVYTWRRTAEVKLKMYIPKEGMATVFTKSRKYLGKEKIKIEGKTYNLGKKQ